MAHFVELDKGQKINWSLSAESIYPEKTDTSKPSEKSEKQVEQIVLDFLKTRSNFMNLTTSPKIKFSIRRTETDKQHAHAVRIQEIFSEIPVYGTELIVHVDPYDRIVRLKGNVIPSVEVNTTPTITKDKAIEIALNDAGKDAKLSSNISPRIEIYPSKNKHYLAWRLRVIGNEKVRKEPALWQYFIDALSGTIIDKYNNYQSLILAPSQGTGVGLNGITRQLHTAFDNPTHRYYTVDMSRGMSNSGAIQTYDYENDGYDRFICNIPDNRLSSTPNNQWKDKHHQAIVDLHYYLGVVYDYFKTHHNRDSVDGKGMTLKALGHVYDKWKNAHWDSNCKLLAFGDGDGIELENMANSLDVVAHEFTHGVTQFTANLVYRGEYGALNESFSDVFAALIANDNNWIIGENTIPNGNGLRNMSDPTRGGLYDKNDSFTRLLYTKAQPDHYSNYWEDVNNDDNGGVHINSGIPNKVAYLISEGGTHNGQKIKSIGKIDTGKIYYRALVYELGRFSDFSDLRDALEQACKDEFPNDVNRLQTVSDALTSVGL